MAYPQGRDPHRSLYLTRKAKVVGEPRSARGSAAHDSKDCKDHVDIFNSPEEHLVRPHHLILRARIYLNGVTGADKPSRIHVCSGLVENKVDITRTIESILLILTVICLMVQPYYIPLECDIMHKCG